MIVRRFGVALSALVVAALVILVANAPAAAQERFEVKSIKAVRPTIVNTISALEKQDIAGAREAFGSYDSAWNGIEVYINVRNREVYQTLEHGFQARISKGLQAANPDAGALLADARAMLAKFDETVSMIENAAPLNALFDEVARLRIVRAHLRQVLPAMKAGNLAKARESFTAFDENWDSIEDLIKARSLDSYVAIEKNMIEVEQALMAEKPDSNKVAALVDDIMTRYNAALAEITKEARAR